MGNACAQPPKAPEREKIKCCVVGDSRVGKTSLLCTFSKGEFPQDRDVPTTLEIFKAQTRVRVRRRGDVYVDFDLYDTAGQDGMPEMRKLSYPDTDVFLVLFSMADRASLASVRSTWLPELQRSPEAGWEGAGRRNAAQLVLVGTKMDRNVITRREALALAREIGAYAYVGCSARHKDGVQEVFETVVKAKLGLEQHDSISAAGEGSAPAPDPRKGGYDPYERRTTAERGAAAQPAPAPVYRGQAQLRQGLPPRWEARVDPQNGKRFFVDHSTRTTHWEPPVGWTG